MSSAAAARGAAVAVSNARAEASRKNGAKSRGPKTPEGKARSARNALKHGMRAQKYVVLPDEDAAAVAALESALIAELAPVGALQAVLARRGAVAAWRLARAAGATAGSVCTARMPSRAERTRALIDQRIVVAERPASGRTLHELPAGWMPNEPWREAPVACPPHESPPLSGPNEPEIPQGSAADPRSGGSCRDHSKPALRSPSA